MTTGVPHLIGIDDGPFQKGQAEPVPVVGVVMEGARLVEGVAVTRFPVDGDDATGFLRDWVGGLRWRPTLDGMVLGGITLCGLGIVDLAGLAAALGLPVIAVTRRDTRDHELDAALTALGLEERRTLVAATPASVRIREGLHASFAGASDREAAALLQSCLHKAKLPEPLRIAHLIAAALVNGQSSGRV